MGVVWGALHFPPECFHVRPFSLEETTIGDGLDSRLSEPVQRDAEICAAVHEKIVVHVALLERHPPSPTRVPPNTTHWVGVRVGVREQMFRDSGDESLPVDLSDEGMGSVGIRPDETTEKA